MSFKKKTVAAAVAVTLGAVGSISTASAGSLVLTFANNAGANGGTGITTDVETRPGASNKSGVLGFSAGNEFHVATPYGTSSNDGQKDIISGGETWTFANAASNTSVVSALMTGVTGTGTNAGHSGVAPPAGGGTAKLTTGVTGYPVAGTPGTNDTIAQDAPFFGAGFGILAPTVGSLTADAFGEGHLQAYDEGAGTFEIFFPVLQVQWADGTYLIGGDPDNTSHTDKCTETAGTPDGCPGPGFTFFGTLSSGAFTLVGSQEMFKDEVTVGGFNRNIVEFSLQGTYVTTLDHASAVPVPAAAWLFGSGLMGMVGVARRRRNKV